VPIVLLSRPRLSSFLPETAIRPYVFFLSALFVLASLAGIVAPPSVRHGLTDAFRLATEPYTNQSGGGVFLFILANNLIATSLTLLLGVAFGILPVVAVGFNGFLVGVLCREVARGVGYVQTALHVLPHGVFEIPALLLAAAYGLWIGVAALQRVRGHGGLDIRGQLKHALRRYAAVVVPLLVIAAVIETALAVM